LTDLVDGNYIARIQSDNYQSKGVKLIIKKWKWLIANIQAGLFTKAALILREH
jgi:hypothetical protein